MGLVSLSGCVVATGSTRASGSAGVFLLFIPLVLFGAMVFFMRRMVTGPRPRSAVRRVEQPRVSAPMLRAELSVLADDVLRLEPQVALKPDARNDYDAAVHRYRVARAALDDAEAPVDLSRVQRVVDEATWSMARARAIVEERPLPSPPDVLRRPGPHGEPAVRTDERDTPTYVSSQVPYRVGWFTTGGGLFGGLLLGSILGGFGAWYEEGIDDEADDVDGGSQR